MNKVSVFLLSGLLVGWLVFASGGSRTPVRTPQMTFSPFSASPGVEPKGHMQDLRLVEQADTATAWEIHAWEAAWYATSQHAEVHRVRARLFQGERPPISLEAEYGHIAQATGNISVNGDVRLRHLAGYTVTTDALHWRAADRLLYTDAPVQIVSATVHIRGMGFRSKIEQRQFTLQQHVRASLRLD